MASSRSRLRKSLILLITLIYAPFSAANEENDVLKVVYKWASLENALKAQAELVTDDRIQLFEMWRRVDQAQNLKIQLSQRAFILKQDPHWNIIVTIEAPIVRIYSDAAAIVSFIRMYEVIPGNELPKPMWQTYISMTLVKENGDWKIAHMHGSAD